MKYTKRHTTQHTTLRECNPLSLTNSSPPHPSHTPLFIDPHKDVADKEFSHTVLHGDNVLSGAVLQQPKDAGAGAGAGRVPAVVAVSHKQPQPSAVAIKEGARAAEQQDRLAAVAAAKARRDADALAYAQRRAREVERERQRQEEAAAAAEAEAARKRDLRRREKATQLERQVHTLAPSLHHTHMTHARLVPSSVLKNELYVPSPDQFTIPSSNADITPIPNPYLFSSCSCCVQGT